ncbi:hypothetical protein ABVK25_010419 [Lepraria finkii]|uniref:Uncharacterized protein n=1 Tax=Lepraria finkii TaxID=1340010 RepID=A0ABR4AWL7_9LECA
MAEEEEGEIKRSNSNESDSPSQETEAPKPKEGRVNGGLIAWLQVLGAFCLFFTSWGIVNSFGVYQTYYENDLLSATSTSSQISWIGSIQAFLLVVIGVVTGPIFDQGYLQPLL